MRKVSKSIGMALAMTIVAGSMSPGLKTYAADIESVGTVKMDSSMNFMDIEDDIKVEPGDNKISASQLNIIANGKIELNSKKIIKEIRVSGSGVQGNSGKYTAHVVRKRTLQLNAEVFDQNGNRLNGEDGAVEWKLLTETDGTTLGRTGFISVKDWE